MTCNCATETCCCPKITIIQSHGQTSLGIGNQTYTWRDGSNVSCRTLPDGSVSLLIDGMTCVLPASVQVVGSTTGITIGGTFYPFPVTSISGMGAIEVLNPSTNSYVVNLNTAELVSTDVPNALTLGADGALYVPVPTFVGQLPNTVEYYGTRLQASNDLIPSQVELLYIGGYSVERKDALAKYREVPNVGALEYWQFQSNSGTRRWEIAEDRVTLRMFDAQGSNLIPSSSGVDDYVPIQKLMDYQATHFEVHCDYNGVWVTSKALNMTYPATGVLSNQSRWTAGTFCAANGSSGDTLITIRAAFTEWEGELGAYGANTVAGNGVADYASRGWVDGIDMGATRVSGADWVAEGFKRHGFYHNGLNANVIATVVRKGRARFCGSRPFGGSGSEVTTNFIDVDRSGSAGGFNSLGQTSVVSFTAPLLPELGLDDMILFAAPAVIVTAVGTGAIQHIQLPETATQPEWLTVTISGSPAAYDNQAPTSATNYRLTDKNRAEVLAPAGTPISITVQRWYPCTVSAIASDRLSMTINGWLLGDIKTGTMKYAHGAALRCTGGNTAGARFESLDATSCASSVRVDGLYAPAFGSIVSQFCYSHITLGNPPNSFTYGFTVDSHHSEATVVDMTVLSALKQGAYIGAATALGTIASTATGGVFAKIWQVSPLEDNTKFSRSLNFLEGVTLNYIDGVITPREGMTQGLSRGSFTATNQPHNNDINQIIDTSTVSLKFIVDLDRLYKGYTKVVYEVFGSATNNGPTGNTIVRVEPSDADAGYTLSGGMQNFPGVTLTVPPNKLGYPIRIVAVIDRTSSGNGKNWRVTWETIAPMMRAVHSYTLNPASFVGTQVQTVPIAGVNIGDQCVANFSISSPLWRVEGLPATAAGQGRFQFVSLNGATPVDPGSGIATVGVIV